MARRGAVEARGVVVGSGAPARPSLSDLLRRGESLCERSVLVRVDGATMAMQAQRLRELNRTPRPTNPGVVVPAALAQHMARMAAEHVAVGDVEGSDEARGGSLPHPHREGSSPCSGPRRPAAITRALREWQEGEGYDEASEADMIALAREAFPKRFAPRIRTLDDARAVALEVERGCVEIWATWSERALRGRAAAVLQRAREVRAMYRPVKPEKVKAPPRRRAA